MRIKGLKVILATSVILATGFFSVNAKAEGQAQVEAIEKPKNNYPVVYCEETYNLKLLASPENKIDLGAYDSCFELAQSLGIKPGFPAYYCKGTYYLTIQLDPTKSMQIGAYDDCRAKASALNRQLHNP